MVETQGENYDLIENFNIGEATWQSHPDRIMDGSWKNYVLTDTVDKVIFNSNAVGSLIFDKNSCSYSIYENGYNGNQIIPSVSAIASFQSNGVWSNLPVNDEACTVTVSEYDDGVFLTSTKVITEDITEDVFISYTGTDELFYGNGTNSAFTLLQSTNGTNIGYFNGEVTITEGAVVDKFVQELDLNIKKGFKETFKVIHDGDEPLGISQTIHSGESITIGETTINIAELNGQSFDRQYIIDNEAEILQITDSVNYDFDTGIDSLTNVNIIFDGDYKVNMDYANGNDGVPFVGYLEIDPTFSSSWATQQKLMTNGSTMDTNDCNISGNHYPSWNTSVESEMAYLSHEGNGNGVCAMPAYEFDISSIPDTNTIVDVVMVYDLITVGSESGSLTGFDWINSDEQIATTSGVDLQTQYLEMKGNTQYVQMGKTLGTNLLADLGTTGDSDLQNSLSQDFFTTAIRLEPFDNHPTSSWQLIFENVELQVTYGIFTAPNAPTGLSTTIGIPLGTSWTSPDVSTNYKVHSFTTTGASTFQVTAGSGDVEYLIVGGGGQGGGGVSGADGGSGGAGGYRTSTSSSVTAQSYTVTVGAGGYVSNSGGYNGVTGGDSSFNSITSSGGGYGGGGWTSAGNDGNVGGSGGSGGSSGDGSTVRTSQSSSPVTSPVQGYASGSSTGGGTSGGGGGSSSVGQNDSDGGAGGTGTANSFTGTSVTYATGGSTNGAIGVDGQGDGGGGSVGAGEGFTGGDGIVIIRYVDDGSITATGGTVTTFTESNGGNGGSPITGYKVYRSDSAVAQTELPNSSGSDSELTFTDNEFLLHGFESTTTRDSTFDGTNSGATVSQTGKLGSAWSFDGTNDSVDLGSASKWVGKEDLSFSLWLNLDSATNDWTVPFQIGDAENPRIALTMDYYNSGGLMYYKMSEGSGNNYAQGSASAPAKGSWTHIVGVMDGSTSDIQLYVDGSSVSTTVTGTPTGTPSNLAGNGYLGNSMYGSTSYWTNGLMDQLVFYDTALTPSDVTALYNSGSGDSTPDTTGMIAHYDFEQTGSTLENQLFNTATALSDKSTNSIPITLTTGTTTTGSIGTAIQSPDLTYTDSNLPDNTDVLSVGGFVKLDAPKDSTKDGILTGATSPSVTGKLGNAWDFDGSNDLVTSGLTQNLGDQFSVSYWVNFDTFSPFPTIMGKSTSDASEEFISYITGGSQFGGEAISGASLGTSFNPSTNTWYHVVHTIDGTAGSYITYINGVAYVSSTTSTNTNTYGTESFKLGTSRGNNYFNGQFDQTLVYDDVITSSEVSALYNSGSGDTTPHTDNMLLHYDFEQTGTTLENQATSAPANTKLLGLNGITFNVGTTSASVGDGTYQYSGNIQSTTSGNTMSHSGETAGLAEMYVDPSNTRLFGIFDGSNKVSKYTCTDAWALDGCSYSQSSNVMTDNNPFGLEFSDDGTKMWHIGSGVDYVYYHTLSTAWDLSTITYNVNSLSIASSSAHSTGFQWVNSGNQFMLGDQESISGGIGSTHRTVYEEWGCTTPYDITTCSESESFTMALGQSQGNTMSPDGTVIIGSSGGVYQGSTGDEIQRYDCSTGFDLSTCSATGSAVSFSSYSSNFSMCLVSDDGSKMLCVDGAGQNILSFTMPQGTANTFISATSLTDNSITPQHYSFTRGASNDWTIYQNGVSQATATDSTSLGANSATGAYSQTTQNTGEALGHTNHINAGQKILAGHELIGKHITSCSWWVQQSGGTPSGDLVCDVLDSSGTLVGEVGRIATSTVSTSAQEITMSGGVGAVIQENYILAIRMTVPDDSNRYNVYHQNSDVDSNSHWKDYSSGAWIDVTGKDMYFKAGYVDNKSYTTNISGSLDEFFINSDTLTSTEIAGIADRGAVLTPLTTTGASTTTYDDNTVTGGNTYYYAIKAENAVGLSDFTTFVSGLAGSPAQPPTSVATAINTPDSTPLEVTVSWSAPTNVGTGTLTGFEIYRDGTLVSTTGLVTSYIETVPSVGTYVYSLKAIATHGTSTISATSSIDTPTAPPAPNAPTLAITNPNPSPLDIDISWTAQSNGGSSITSTEIFRTSSLSVAFTSVGTVTDLDFTDTVPNAGTWYYKTASTNLIGSSGQSGESSITTATVPASDSSVTLAISDPNASPRGITVSLVAPSSDGGSAVTGYNIYSSDDNATFTSVATGVTADTTITVPTGGTWYFTSEAINNVGTATQGSSVSIATPTVPTASGVTLAIPSPDPSPLGMVATFTVPSSDGGSALTGYNLLSSSDDVTYDYVAQAVNGDQTITVGNAGTWYFKSQAINNVGNGTLSTAVSITTASAPVSDSSVTLTITDPNPSPLDITISLVAPSGNGGSAVTGYNIYSSDDNVTFNSIASAVNGNQTVTVASAGTWYFTSEAINNAGTATQGSSVSIATPTVPTASSVTLTIDNPDPSPLTVTASFISPSSDGGSIVTGFNLYSSPDDSVYTPIAEAVNGNQTVTVANDGTWYFKSEAINNIGNGTLSSAVSIATPTVPLSDASVTLTIPDPNGFPFDSTATFVAPSSDGGSSITAYNLFYSDDDISYSQIATASNSVISQTLTGAGTHYFKVESINNIGTSAQSSAITITTATVPPAPTVPTSVVPNIDTAPYTVTVSWGLPSSTGGSDLTGYNLYRQTGTGAFSLITTTTALSYIDTLPTVQDQPYTYKIHALNNVGESTAFASTTITSGGVPSAPTISVTTGTTVLSWSTPSSDATVNSYKVYRDGVFLTTVTTTGHGDFTPISFGQSYTYTVIATSIFGDSVSSNSVSTTPETEITGMIAQGVTGTGAVINWEEPAYYQGQVTSYNVYYQTPSIVTGTPSTNAGTTTNTYSNFAPQLEYDTSYTFAVSINSPLGGSGLSNLVTVTTSIDGSIVAFDPTTGGMTWFDIDSVNDKKLNVIEFQRETQLINSTATDTLQVAYPSWWDSMTCNVDYKFAQKTEQYVEGTDMTAQVNSADANQQIIGFSFQDINNEVVTVECAPQQTDEDDASSGKYVMTQNNLGVLQSDGTYSVGTPSIPLVAQISNFSNGSYGTGGDFGALNIVGLFAIMISMVGFNRLSPIVGVLLSASLIFVLAWFGIVTIPVVVVGVIALVIFLAWGINRNR